MSRPRKASQKAPCDQQLISLAELAKLWSCSRSTVARALERAGVQAYDFSLGSRNGTKRYVRDEVSRFIEQCRPSQAH